MGNIPLIHQIIPEACKVYTPRPLADAMVAALSKSQDATWLEPSVGEGVFLRSLSAAGVRKSQIVGIDLDSECRAADRFGKIYRGCDALAWMRAVQGKFSRIIGNPPYASLSEVRGDVLQEALQVPLLETARSINLGSNLWVAFVCAAVRKLEHGGAIAFILPAAWDYAAYADEVRQSLPTLFRSFYVIRSATPLFPGIQDGCVVIVGRGYGEAHRQATRLECEGIGDVCMALKSLRGKEYLTEGRDDSPRAAAGASLMSDLAEIKIGVVTGDSQYFVLRESERREFGLPGSAVMPVLTKARHLLAGSITKSVFDLLREADEPVWLFKPGAAALRSPAVEQYLRRRIVRSVRARTKVRARPRWHSPQVPERCHGFVSGMTTDLPHIALRAMPGLTATNTLYIVTFRTFADRYQIALGLLSSSVWHQMSRMRRRYPDGLLKLEPAEFGRLRVTPLRLANADHCYREAAAALKAGEGDAVMCEIDALLQKQDRGQVSVRLA